MTFEGTYEVNNKNKLVIKLPDKFKARRKVRVIIEEINEDRSKKLELIKDAAKDPLFLSDINDIQKDFQYSDSDSI